MPEPAAARAPRRVESDSERTTRGVAAELAETLAPGDVVLVSGELGAGKTTFVRGACAALGVAGPVTSPTFTIGQRYRGDVAVAHVDLYRLTGLAREDPALLEDYLDANTVTFVEWPEHADGALPQPAGSLREVRIAHLDGDRRVIELR